MKPIVASLLLAFCSSANSAFLGFNIHRTGPATQIKMGSSPPPSSSNQDPPQRGEVILSDVMGRDKSINIFAGFTRDIECIETRLNEPKVNTTVLAPLNSAIEALPRKPWEDPRDYGAMGADAYEGEDGFERAQRNLRRFVEAHIVPRSPWAEGEKIQTIGGANNIWWESRDGGKVIQPGNVEVVEVSSSVSNGEVWIIKGVLNYA